MDHNAADRLFDAGRQLQQLLAQRADLSPGEAGASGLAADFLQQRIGGGREQDPELIGPEAGATGAINFQTMM